MISTFDKDYSEKFIALLPLIDSALLIAKPIAKTMAKPFNYMIKRKHSRLVKSSVKQTRKV